MSHDALLTEEQRLVRDAARAFALAVLAPNAAGWDRMGPRRRHATRGRAPDRRVEPAGHAGARGPGGGSKTDDLAYALRMRAVLDDGGDGDGGHWVLNGAKQFITSGRSAGLSIVFAVTDPALGKKGLSAFLVPTDTPDFAVEREEHKLGIRASDTCAISLTHVRVPAANLLGQRGEGLRIATSNLEGGRIGIGAQAVGIARAGLDAPRACGRERVQFGKPIVEHQAIGQMLAAIDTRLSAARLMVHHAARLRMAGVPCISEASQAKLMASEMAEWVVSKAIQVHGGYGYLQDHAVERHYREARITQVYEGTSEV